MIFSAKNHAKLALPVSGVMLALCIGFCTFQLTFGQDFDAVERRLGAAVAEGEMTLVQAVELMKVLRASGHPDRPGQPKNAIEQRLRKLGEDLRKRFAAGEITKQEMENQYNSAQRKMWGRTRDTEKTQEAGKPETKNSLEELRNGIEQRLKNLGEDLRKRAAAGKITREEMETQYQSAERKMWGYFREAEMKQNGEKQKPKTKSPTQERRSGIDQRLRQLGEDLRKRVAAGEITREEMEAKYNAAQREMQRAPRQEEKNVRRKTPGESSAIRIREIEEAVKSGKISREEGARAIEETMRDAKQPTRRRRGDSAQQPNRENTRGNTRK